MEVEDRKALVDAVMLLLYWRDLDSYPPNNAGLRDNELKIIAKAELTVKKINHY